MEKRQNSEAGSPSPSARSLEQVMTRNPECVTREDSLERAAKLMEQCDCGAIPVVEERGGKVVGMITDRDIVIRAIAKGRDVKECKVSDAMTDQVFSVREGEGVDRVLDLMSERQIRRVPVVDREDRIIGIVAFADVATELPERGAADRKIADTIEKVSETKREHSR